jgi:hypothetical protein
MAARMMEKSGATLMRLVEEAKVGAGEQEERKV